MNLWRMYTCVVIFTLSYVVSAEERLDMEGMEIRGNQELPKVLYVIPWKTSTLPVLTEPPLESLIDEALAPVERELFRREVIYYDSLVAERNPGNENQ